MTTQQITKAGKSVSQSQVTELQTSANNISAIIDTLTLDPWQNLNAAITGIESQTDNNDTSNADDSDRAPNSETDTDTEINNLVTDNNETPLLDTTSDPIIKPVDSSDDNTANTNSSDEVIDNTTDTTIEPIVKPNESSAVDNTSNEIQIDELLLDTVISDETSDTPNSFEDQVTNADDGTSITDNSSEVIDNPEVVADIDNEIQIDEPLTDVVDVTDDSIMGGLVTLNNLNEMNDPFRMDRFPTINTHLTSSIADNLIWFTATTINTIIVNFVMPNSNKIEVISGRDINLNSNFMKLGDSLTTDETQPTLFSGDNMTAPNDDVFSNSDISILGTLTSNEDSDAPLTDTVDVTDDSIVESLDITNKPLGMDNLDGLIKNNTDSFTDSITDSLTEVTSTIANTDTVDLAEFSSNEIEATSGGDVDLNSNFMESGDSVATDETQPTLFSGDNMTAPNDDVFSNSDISILGTLTSNEDSDVPLPDSADVTDKPIMEDLVTPVSLDITSNLLGIGEPDRWIENNSYKWTQPTFTFADIDFMRLITFSDMEVQAAVEYNINLNLVEPGDPIFTDRTQPTRFYTDFPVATLTSTQFFNTDTLSIRTLRFIEDHDDLLTDTVNVTDDSIVENLDITNEPLGMDNVDLAEFSSNEIEATSGGDIDLNSNFMESGDSVATDETQPTLFSGDKMTTPNDDVFSASNPDIPAFETLNYSADNSPFIQLIGNSENIDGEG